MNRPAAMLQLCLLAALAGCVGCSNGVARPLEILDSGLSGAAGRGPAGSSAPRAGAGGAAITSGRGGMGGSRSELQAGSGGPSDRPDPFCEPPMDPGGEVELMDALNSSIENKTFCPDTRGPGLTRLSASPDWRCYARNWARSQVSDRGGRGFPPVPPGWMFFEDDQTFWWVRRQSPELSDAKEALFGSERGPDNREDLCAAAQRFSYKNIGVGHHRDVWVIFISPFD